VKVIFENEGMMKMELKGKKVFVLGERDGVAAPAIAECVKAAEAEVIYQDTSCFV
jgi:glycine reductase